MTEPSSETIVERRAEHPVLAAFLSFVWQGLGQAYRHRRRQAVAQGVPVALIAIAVLAVVLTIGPLVFAAYLLNPIVALGVIVLAIVLGAWRIFSIVGAARPGGRLAALTAVVLVVVVVGTHAWVANAGWSFYQAGQLIYEPIVHGPQLSTPPQSLLPGQTPSPAPTPTPNDGSPLPGIANRVTVLFIGVDNTHGPERGLTDTLIVASFDPVAHSLAMISLPRDTARLPYYDGGEYAPRINSLMQATANHPELYPDGSMGTLVNEMSYLVGIPIDYYARIDIAGFTALIDVVGGVDIVNETTIDDPGYQFSPTDIGFHLDPGAYHLDGKLATAYARSRHGSSDYERAKRQQQILLALRNRLKDPIVLANVTGILGAVSQIIRTNAPLTRLPEIISVAFATSDAATRHIVLAPPTYAHRAQNAVGAPTSMTELTMDAVAALSIELFGTDSRYSATSP